MKNYQDWIVFLCLMISTASFSQPAIILLGPPGSGKGTQAALLREKFNFRAFSIGTIVRNKTKNHDAVGAALTHYENVDSVNDLLKWALMSNHIAEVGLDDDIILDGWPKQGENLKLAARFFFREDVPIVFEIVTSKEVLVNRIHERLVCPNAACGKSFGRAIAVPSSGICDACETKLVKRAEDTKESLIERIAKYERRREQIHYDYQRQGYEIIPIDGNQDPKTIHEKICSHLRRVAETTLMIEEPWRKNLDQLENNWR